MTALPKFHRHLLSADFTQKQIDAGLVLGKVEHQPGPAAMAHARDYAPLPQAAQTLEQATRDLRLECGQAPGRVQAKSLAANAAFQGALERTGETLATLTECLSLQAERHLDLDSCRNRAVALAERLQFILNAAGVVPGPFDAWLALRGTKTLHLRMRQHDANGRAIAQHLAERIGPESVMYVGLPTHPQHELAKRQMSGFGGMISLELGSRERAAHLLKRVRVFSLAESLGGVESLISHPATMTHASVTPELRLQMGITDGLVRLSCGVEETEDLLADLDQAFQGMPEGGRRGSGKREKASVG